MKGTTGADLEILGRGFLTTAVVFYFTAIFDGNYKFLPSIDLEKFYGQLIKNFEVEGISGNPRNPPKTAPVTSNVLYTIIIL